MRVVNDGRAVGGDIGVNVVVAVAVDKAVADAAAAGLSVFAVVGPLAALALAPVVGLEVGLDEVEEFCH